MNSYLVIFIVLDFSRGLLTENQIQCIVVQTGFSAVPMICTI